MRFHASLRAIVALLLVLTAVLFAIGTTIERSQRDTHHERAGAATSEPADHEEGSASETGEEGAEPTEELLGIEVESVPATVAAVAAALLLAAAVWLRRERLWLWLVFAFGLVFTAGDVRELVHQLDESRTGVAVIAAILIVAHLAVAALAALLLAEHSRAIRSKEIADRPA